MSTKDCTAIAEMKATAIGTSIVRLNVPSKRMKAATARIDRQTIPTITQKRRIL